MNTRLYWRVGVACFGVTRVDHLRLSHGCPLARSVYVAQRHALHPFAAIPEFGGETAADNFLDAAGDPTEATTEIASLLCEATAASIQAAALAFEQAEANLAFGRFHSFPGGAIGDVEGLGGPAE